MIILLAAASLAAAPADQCRARLANRFGEIGSFEPQDTHRSGRTTIMTGTINVLSRPPAAAPGDMAPMHVEATSYRFRCTLRGGKVRRTSVAPA